MKHWFNVLLIVLHSTCTFKNIFIKENINSFIASIDYKEHQSYIASLTHYRSPKLIHQNIWSIFMKFQNCSQSCLTFEVLKHSVGKSARNKFILSADLCLICTWSFPSFGSFASRTSSYLIGLTFLQVFDQMWALQMLMVRMNRPMATLDLMLIPSVSRDRITEKTIMKNWRRATDMMTKWMAVAWIFLFILLSL